jgi:hypothetical protein
MNELPRPVQFQLIVLGPLLAGLVCGFFLGISAASWWVANALAIAAGVLGGIEQSPASAPRRSAVRDVRREAVVRGAVTGAMFGLGVVIAHAASGDPAHAPLPSPEVLFVPFSALIATGLARLGALLAERRQA